jgi:hypothetical protein
MSKKPEVFDVADDLEHTNKWMLSCVAFVVCCGCLVWDVAGSSLASGMVLVCWDVVDVTSVDTIVFGGGVAMIFGDWWGCWSG